MEASQQQTEAAPEAIWFQFIRELYHDLLNQTHFLPPVHFNRTPHDVVTIANQPVQVRVNPPSSGRRRRKSSASSTPAQVVGVVFTENPPTLHPFNLQDSDQRDDVAQQRCLLALTLIPDQVMMVISTLEFQKYLTALTNPLHAAVAAKLPSCHDPCSPKDITNGECDILVIHRHYGFVIAEIKSVGGNEFFRAQEPKNQLEILDRQVRKASQQLKNQERVLKYLVSDLPLLRITKTLMLPNVASAQLEMALVTFPSLLQTLCDALSVPADVSLAVRHCLCQEDLSQPGTWWQTIHAAGPDQAMTDTVYERLVARFCGPATTVDIPTPSPPRRVVRSLGQAVAETGLRFSSLALTPPQVTLLGRRPEPRFLFLLGPPGTGKTVVLLLKALQWLRQGLRVILACGDRKASVVSILMEEQLLRMTSSEAERGRVRRLCYDFREHGFKVKDAVGELRKMVALAVAATVPADASAGAGADGDGDGDGDGDDGDDDADATATAGLGPVLVVFDEIDNGYREEFVQWLREVQADLPSIHVWAAGVWRLERGLVEPLPDWLEMETLQEALRCPPSVTAQLQASTAIRAGFVHGYADPQHPVATPGVPVRRVRHTDGPGHSGDHPWQCLACSDDVGSVIRQLRVGQKGHGLQYRDVWILYSGGVPHPSDPLVQHLRQRHALPVWAVTSRLPAEAEARELALAVTDQVTVAHWTAVQGLERRVVIALGMERFGRALHSQSRCSGFLYVIS